ncbi:unnamed protein product [Dovyalis caffra]|uniref:MADS-box domain-containing protein n=1 Tax=Dovyalis caffra TaxID=77055 RepID=A0AAV1SQH0_9ROSI|nr:unnamed protein product [Dovyalis caffra]
MARNKLPLKKIDNPYRRNITYSKRKAGIIKKATELSVLCGADVGVLMFSPNGRLTSFASNGRIEDIFLRYLDQANVPEVGPVEKEEALQKKLCELDPKLLEKQEKMRSYNPDLVKINSVHDANVYHQFLMDAIRNIQQLKMEILLGEHMELQKSESIQVPPAATRNGHLTAEGLVDSNGNRNPPEDEHQPKEARLPVGPHLSLEYLRTQKHWDLQSGGQSKA